MHRTGRVSSCRCKPLRWLAPDKASRRQVASADWHDASREGGPRAPGKARDKIRRENAAARRKGNTTCHVRASAEQAVEALTGAPLRWESQTSGAEPTFQKAGFRALESGQAQRRGLRIQASAPNPSSDGLGTDKTRKIGQNRHAHTTRQCHWTWRFVSIPWVRRSFGRKRRSGRRSRRSLLQRDHVKVVGRGARPPAVPAGSPARRASARRMGSVTVSQAQHTSVR